MTDEIKQALITRALLIIANLRNCNTGHDIHEVASMRSTAQMLIDGINGNYVDEAQARKSLARIEQKCTDYFKRKFT